MDIHARPEEILVVAVLRRHAAVRDDLIIHMNGRTLDDLYEALANVQLDGEPETAVRALAEGYLKCVTDSAGIGHRACSGRLYEN